MKLPRGIPLFVLAGILVASCSHAPRLATVPAGRQDLRAEFLRNNPDGKFNRHIKNGEIVRGMGVVEVLASWGLPNMRRLGGADLAEYWTYYSRDPHTSTFTVYDLVFQQRVLFRWVVESDIHSYDELVQRDLIGTPPSGTGTRPEDVGGSINDSGTLKKKP